METYDASNNNNNNVKLADEWHLTVPPPSPPPPCAGRRTSQPDLPRTRRTDAQHPHHFARMPAVRGPGVEPETQPDCRRDPVGNFRHHQARVQQRGDGTPAKITPTHYFATLMTALDEGNPSDRQDCMFLLKLLLPHVSQAVLRSKFVDTMDVFSNVLNGGGQNAGSITNPLVRHLIECIGMVLAAQQCAPTFWAQPKTLQSFNAILNLIVDERPKIRKSSHEAIRTLLRGGHARYLANNIVSCLEQLLKSASQKNTKPVLVVLPLVQDILPYLLDSHAVKGGNSSTKSLKRSPAGRLIFALLRTQAFLSDSRFSELTFRSFQNSVVSKTISSRVAITAAMRTRRPPRSGAPRCSACF